MNKIKLGNKMTLSVEELKERGNDSYKNGNYHEAVDIYTQALEIKNCPSSISAVIYKNRAMTRLKTEDYEGAEEDCTKALEIDPHDAKALYRRALALQKLDKIGPAFKDAKEALQILPGDKSIMELCATLLKENAERMKKIDSTENKVNEMLRLSFDKNNATDQLKAMNNLLVLCRDSEDGARKVWQDGKIVTELVSIVNNPNEWSDEFALCAVRILDELAKKRERAVKIVEILGAPTLTRLLAARQPSENRDAASTLIQRSFNGLAAMDHAKEIKPDNAMVEKNKVPIVRLVLELEEIITDAKYSADVRNACINLLFKNLMHMDGGLPRGWSWRFVEERGLFKMLHIASQIPEQCDYPVNAETRQFVALFLMKLYDDMVFDQRRATYKERVDQFFNGVLTEIGERRGRIKLASFLITLLQGAVEVGISLVTNDTITAMMLQMASCDDDLLQQRIAVELIALTVSKHERATAILKNGLPILRKLYHSSDDEVRVRALVGLCKCASAGGDDCSKQTMQEGSSLNLANSCKKFLLNIQKYSVEVRKFACEGLSYLTLDADVKEMIVDDPQLLKALVELAKSAGAICVFTLSSTYVNLCNAYEKPKIDEELVKLAQFAKHHVPETHPLDTEEHVERRVRRLVQDGAVVACVAIAKTESQNALDNLARSLLAFSSHQDLCGRIISEGGARLLLELRKKCSAEGKLKAAHALAKLGACSDPDIAFSGQRAFEVVKPMVDLLHPEVEGRANYDALLTLTNLASKGDPLRRRILKERAVPKIEEFWYDVTHETLRAAAAELLLNLLYCEEYYKQIVKPGTDRLKLWVLYCDEGEDRLRLASSAGFALLTEDKDACQRVIDELKDWPDLFKELAMAENPEVQRRCLMAIANMVESSEKVASEIIATEVFRVLVAITKLRDLPENSAAERAGSMKEAQRALNAAEKWDLIKPTDRQLYERTNEPADKKPLLPTVKE